MNWNRNTVVFAVLWWLLIFLLLNKPSFGQCPPATGVLLRVQVNTECWDARVANMQVYRPDTASWVNMAPNALIPGYIFNMGAAMGFSSPILLRWELDCGGVWEFEMPLDAECEVYNPVDNWIHMVISCTGAGCPAIAYTHKYPPGGEGQQVLGYITGPPLPTLCEGCFDENLYLAAPYVFWHAQHSGVGQYVVVCEESDMHPEGCVIPGPGGTGSTFEVCGDCCAGAHDPPYGCVMPGPTEMPVPPAVCCVFVESTPSLFCDNSSQRTFDFVGIMDGDYIISPPEGVICDIGSADANDLICSPWEDECWAEIFNWYMEHGLIDFDPYPIPTPPDCTPGNAWWSECDDDNNHTETVMMAVLNAWLEWRLSWLEWDDFLRNNLECGCAENMPEEEECCGPEWCAAVLQQLERIGDATESTAEHAEDMSATLGTISGTLSTISSRLADLLGTAEGIKELVEEIRDFLLDDEPGEPPEGGYDALQLAADAGDAWSYGESWASAPTPTPPSSAPTWTVPLPMLGPEVQFVIAPASMPGAVFIWGGLKGFVLSVVTWFCGRWILDECTASAAGGINSEG